MNEENMQDFISALVWDTRIIQEYDGLYHYTSYDAAEKIFKEDAISFRLTKATEFEDKMEGKAIEVYYDLAIEQLYKSKKIDDTLRSKLEAISVPDKRLVTSRHKDGTTQICEKPVTPYVICFSTVENDDYMYRNYILKDCAGYCFEFSDVDINELCCLGTANNVVIKTTPVLYGEQVIEYIKEKINEIIRDEKN